MKTINLFFKVLIVLGISQASYTQDLDTYLKVAADNNSNLKAKFAAFEASLQRVTQAQSLPDPTLSFGYFVLPIETRVGPQKARIGLTQMFPWFGTLRSAGNAQALEAEAKYQEFQHAKDELYWQIKTAWYPMWEINQNIRLQEENKKILESYKQIATTQYKNGKGTMVDILRVDLMLDNIQTEIQLLEDLIPTLSVQFNRLLNQADSAEIQISDTLEATLVSKNLQLDSFLTDHPLLNAFDLRLEAAKEMEDLSLKQGLPKFGVGVDYIFVGQRTDMVVPNNGKNALMPMISMTLPIYRAKYSAATREAQINQIVLSESKTTMENMLISKYEQAWYDYSQAQQKYVLYESQIEKTKQIIALLESAYSNSGKDFEEILRMQQELIKYKMAIVTSIKNTHVAIATMDYLTSKSE